MVLCFITWDSTYLDFALNIFSFDKINWTRHETKVVIIAYVLTCIMPMVTHQGRASDFRLCIFGLRAITKTSCAGTKYDL